MTQQNITEDSTLRIEFNTTDPSSAAPAAPSANFTTADVLIQKNGSTSKATTNGLTMASPYNPGSGAKTGSHLLTIDTSNDTGDAGFWEVGATYHVMMSTAKTVGGESIDGLWIPRGKFGIQAGVAGAIVEDTENIQSRIPDALDGGNMKAKANDIATDAIDADSLKADAVTEIQAGLATSSELTSVETNIINAIAAINTGAARYIAILTAAAYERPESGSEEYGIEIRTFDANGDPVDLDAAADPVVTMTRVSDGTDLSAALSSLTNPAVGVWRLTYSVASSDDVESLRIDAAGTIATVAKSTAAYPVVTDAVAIDYTAADRARDDAIKAFVDASTVQTADVATRPTASENRVEMDDNSSKLATIDSNVSTLLGRVPAALFSGITSLASWLGTLFGKTADAVTLAEITSTTGGTTFDNTTDSPEAIRDHGGDGPWTQGSGGGGTGSGPHTITATVTTGGALPIQNARISYTLSGTHLSAVTDVNGQAVFNVDAGTWTVAITANGYSFSGATHAVGGSSSPTYVMDTNAIEVPLDPALSTGVLLCRNFDGSLDPGVSVHAELLSGPGTAGHALDRERWTIQADTTTAVAMFIGMIRGATYRIYRGKDAEQWSDVTVPDQASFDIDEVIGHD